MVTITALLHATFSHHQQGRIDFNTVNPYLSTGKGFLIHSLQKNWCWEIVRTPPKLGKYWEIHPLRPPDFPPLSWWSTDTILRLNCDPLWKLIKIWTIENNSLNIHKDTFLRCVDYFYHFQISRSKKYMLLSSKFTQCPTFFILRVIDHNACFTNLLLVSNW